jgi:8-oxo-dGTP pyrophosphatase MutT (NUDIX family)
MNDNASLPWVRQLLRDLGTLPADVRRELPLLFDIAVLCAASGAPPASWGPVRQGLNRRYLRIRFVQGELERLDFNKAAPGAAFNDFVFDQIDFSMYKKIPEEEFTLFSGGGLEDFDPSFFERAFRLSREKAGLLINAAYTRIGGFYYVKQEKLLANPLIMAILRNLQTSLEFGPLFTAGALQRECAALLRFLEDGSEVPGTRPEAAFYLSEGFDRFFAALIRALHGSGLTHSDGMRTDLSAVHEAGGLTLKGTFHPQGKGYTIPLV